MRKHYYYIEKHDTYSNGHVWKVYEDYSEVASEVSNGVTFPGYGLEWFDNPGAKKTRLTDQQVLEYRLKGLIQL